MVILLIVPHLSTGGLPSVALKRVQSLVNEQDVYLIEYRQIAWSYVVQRNEIEKILGDRFISLGNVWGDGEEKRDEFINIVKKINPDVIHMEEIPEMFLFGMNKEHLDWLYRSDRGYKIIETTHTSTFNVNDKKYFPDEFMFVSKYSQLEYRNLNVPSSVIEYPSEKQEKNKYMSMKKLEWNPEFFHILNVGLFNKDKNQSYLFELAKILKDYKIKFNFVGNLADNFSDYWKPLLENVPDNCIIYGERNDVDLFYQSSDLLIHSSILELNPLAIKEATSYDIPVLLNNLPTYLNMYDSYKNVKYLTMNLEKDSKYILDNFNIKKISDTKKFKNELIDKYKDIVNNIKNDTDNFNVNDFKYNISFLNGAKVEITGDNYAEFKVDFIDKNSNQLIYSSNIYTNNWCSTLIEYYKEYKINIYHNNKLIISHDFDLTNRNVLIFFDSKSIGDTIAWFPYVEEFRKKHNCNVYCSTHWNDWFKETYPEITFLEIDNIVVPNLYAKYNIGWYSRENSFKNPTDYKKIPLQQTSSDILGLKYEEIAPKISSSEGIRPIEEKYVCIAQFSTTNSKHWHYPFKNSNNGWQILVDWLNNQGYKVMVISKQKTNLQNIIDMTGDFPIEHRINQLKYCEFFIGIGSGLSWLAWAIGKKVVMISGFSDPICEFKSNNIYVHNFNVCNGCFNRHEFDRGDWDWCPDHKNTDRQFECTIKITPKMVIDKIISNNLISEKNDNFDFQKYNTSIVIDKNDVNLTFNETENKFYLKYKNSIKTPLINIDVKNYNNNEIYYTVKDISLSNEYIVWFSPNIKVKEKTNKVSIVLYENNIILELVLNI